MSALPPSSRLLGYDAGSPFQLLEHDAINPSPVLHITSPSENLRLNQPTRSAPFWALSAADRGYEGSCMWTSENTPFFYEVG
jgi:hypothetical protein